MKGRQKNEGPLEDHKSHEADSREQNSKDLSPSKGSENKPDAIHENSMSDEPIKKKRIKSNKENLLWKIGDIALCLAKHTPAWPVKIVGITENRQVVRFFTLRWFLFRSSFHK